MKIDLFKKKIDLMIENHINQKIQEYSNYYKNNRINDILSYYKKFILTWGKRIRPYIFYIFYKMYKGKTNKKIWDIAMSFELLHNALLIHDDIMDNWKTRHWINCFHIYLQDEVYQNKVWMWVWQSIVVANLLYWIAVSLITKSIKWFSNNNELLNNYFKMFELVNYGQMIDFDFLYEKKVSKKNIIKKNYLKTASYTFIFPMILWYLFTNGNNQKEISKIFKIWKYLWNAFQIKDDYNDVFLEKDNKTLFSDIQAWQHTLITDYLFSNLKWSDLELFNKLFWKKISNKQMYLLKTIINNTNLVEYVKKELKLNIKIAIKLINTLDAKDEKFLHYFLSIIDKLNIK